MIRKLTQYSSLLIAACVAQSAVAYPVFFCSIQGEDTKLMVDLDETSDVLTYSYGTDLRTPELTLQIPRELIAREVENDRKYFIYFDSGWRYAVFHQAEPEQAGVQVFDEQGEEEQIKWCNLIRPHYSELREIFEVW